MKNLIFISQNQKLVNLNQVFRTFQRFNCDKPNFHTSKPKFSRSKPKYKSHNKKFSQCKTMIHSALNSDYRKLYRLLCYLNYTKEDVATLEADDMNTLNWYIENGLLLI